VRSSRADYYRITRDLTGIGLGASHRERYVLVATVMSQPFRVKEEKPPRHRAAFLQKMRES
jgi:hypothetical protein